MLLGIMAPNRSGRTSQTFQHCHDVLADYSNADLLQRYGLDRPGILFVTDLVRGKLESRPRRSTVISSEVKVMATLRYLATGRMMPCDGCDLGLSHQSISRVISQTLNALTAPNLLSSIVKFPLDPQELKRKQAEFKQIADFPGVFGVIGSTHVPIMAPKEFTLEYMNRSIYHSIKVQLIFDANCKLLNVVANWPGCTHEAHILNTSGVKRIFERNLIPAGCHLLGDRNYPCRHWLLTPYKHPQTNSQISYNREHEKARSVMENGIELLKKRFQVLNGDVRLNPRKTCQVILACAMLHNIYKERNVMMPDECNDWENEEDSDEEDYDFEAYEGFRFRENWTNINFCKED